MTIKRLMSLLLLMMTAVVISCSTCPVQDAILQGEIYCNGKWKSVWTYIKKGELDKKEYITKEEWEKMKGEIKLDAEKDKLDRTEENKKKKK